MSSYYVPGIVHKGEIQRKKVPTHPKRHYWWRQGGKSIERAGVVSAMEETPGGYRNRERIRSAWEVEKASPRSDDI